MFMNIILLSRNLYAEKCGATDVFECLQDYTCCQGPTGRICHNVKDGYCCEDLLTCCDSKNFKCDNKNHKCVPIKKDSQMKFLTESEI
jgi:hypothetical protein